MLRIILRKRLIILILTFNVVFVNAIKCEIVLFPDNLSMFYKNKIHIVGMLDKKKIVLISVNGKFYEITSDKLIRIRKKKSINYLFTKNIELSEGENNIQIGSGKNNVALRIYLGYNLERRKKNGKWSYFHMNEKLTFCKKCHYFKKTSDCFTCHNYMKNSKYLHGPIAAKQCFFCHDKNNYFTLKKPISMVCLKCHQEFANSMYNAKFSHAPVIAGNCMICHKPHSSVNKYFVKKNINKICLLCHITKKNGEHVKKVMYSYKKRKQGVITCVSCHNPHYGETNSLLCK